MMKLGMARNMGPKHLTLLSIIKQRKFENENTIYLMAFNVHFVLPSGIGLP